MPSSGDELAAYVAVARTKWPAIDVDVAAFAAYLAALVPTSEGLPPTEHAGDLWLAHACLTGVAAAISAFHVTYGSVIRRVLARRRAPTADMADVAQITYERLLVRTSDREPLLTEYRGQGSLRSWVSTAAARTFLTLVRSEGRRRSNEGADPPPTGLQILVADPELIYFKRLYKREIELALGRSVALLDDHARALLELHLAEGLSIDQLGTMYGVNRTTTARWLTAAREALVRSVRAELRRELKLSESEYDSILALVRSELDVTVAVHLRAKPGAVAGTP